MKTKILDGLKQKYSNLGLSEDVLTSHAETLAGLGFVTDENLNTVIDGQKNFLSALQSNIDKRVTQAVEKVKNERNNPPTPPINPPIPPKTEDEKKGFTIEDIQKAVAEAVKPFSEKINQFETESKKAVRAKEIEAKAKEFGIPMSVVNRMAIADDADLTNYFTEVKQEFTNLGFESSSRKPEAAAGTPQNSSALSEMINTGTKAIIEKSDKK